MKQSSGPQAHRAGLSGEFQARAVSPALSSLGVECELKFRSVLEDGFLGHIQAPPTPWPFRGSKTLALNIHIRTDGITRQSCGYI